jgi:phage shock protein C
MRSFFMEKKLYKSSTDKMLAGVCGGVAEYFELDSTWVRLGYAALVILAGTGVLLYIVCAIIMPERPRV